MVARQSHRPLRSRGADRLCDVLVTCICWTYFTFGFLLVFSPFYLAAALFSPRPEYRFQRLNRAFYRGFFALLKRIAPRQQWVFDKDIAEIRSAVIVCNHLSYLDPLLLIALLGRSKTIVKPVFFTIPIFGWVLRTAGYFPAAATGRFAGLMLKQMENMGTYLAEGGNIFIFPEGTRSRDGSVGMLNQGALKIARYCRAPVYVLCLTNTDRLFTPGKFFFRTREHNSIGLGIVDRLAPDHSQVSLADLHARIRQGLERCSGGSGGTDRSGRPAAELLAERER